MRGRWGGTVGFDSQGEGGGIRGNKGEGEGCVM